MEDVTNVNVEDEEYWNMFNLQEIPLIDDEDDEPEGMDAVADEQQSKLKMIMRSIF